jgi:hypothetical protein
MPTVDELINFAIGQQPTKFASAFDDIMGEKAAEAIDTLRTNIAQGLYASEEDLESEDLDDEDEDDLDDDIDEDEFDDVDDLDLDDDDLDFDDSDLEGLDDDGEDA